MNFKELNKTIESDFDLNPHTLETKLREIPKLHNKYLKIWFKEKNKLLLLEKELKSLYRKKWYYYHDDYSYNLDKKHIEWHIESDDEYSKKLYIFDRQKHLVNYFEQVIRKVNSFNFDIKNFIEYKKFLNGIV